MPDDICSGNRIGNRHVPAAPSDLIPFPLLLTSSAVEKRAGVVAFGIINGHYLVARA